MGIAGDPAALYAAADEMAATGRDFFEVAEAIAAHGRAVTSNWFGDASEAAGRHIEGLSRRVQVGSEVYAGAARAIRTYAGELAAAQDAWGEAAGRAATAAADLAGAQRASAAAAAMVTTDAAGHLDPGAEAAQARAAGEAAGALSAAGAAGNVARQDMDAAVAAALAANQRAADAINACCDQLAGMGGQPSAAATSVGADTAGGSVVRDASGAAATGTASASSSSAGLSKAEVIVSAALQAMTPFWLVGGVDLSEAPGDVVRDQVGGLGEAAWNAGPGAVGWALGLSGGKVDAAASDEITKVHDWLQKWWGADTTSSAYKDEKLAGDVAGLFVGGGKVRDTAKFGKVVLKGFEDGTAEKGLGEITSEAVKSGGHEVQGASTVSRDIAEVVPDVPSGGISESSSAAASLARIADGHAYEKHVLYRGEFPGVRTRRQLADLISDVVESGEVKGLARGRRAWWKDGVVVIESPSSRDGGTVFRPGEGRLYFDENLS